jgi:hypothetical protein
MFLTRTRFTTSVGRSLALLMMLLLPLLGRGQSPVAYPMSTGDYSEGFADISNWAVSGSTYSGTGGNRFASVPAAGSGTIPDGVTTTVSSAAFTTTTTGGIQKGSAQATATTSLVFLSNGATSNSNAVAIDLLLNFTGRTAGTLSFDYATVFNSTGNRGASLRVYTSTDGTTFTELTAAAVNDLINNVAASGTKSAITLPSSFTNSATARIRFYNFNGTATGTTGSRPKISLDNIAVTSTPTTSITVGALTPAGSFSTVEGTASAIKTYSLSGSNLTANLTVGPLAGYEFSTDGFATTGLSSLSLAPSSGTVSATVSVRIAATTTAAGSPYAGNIANASSGATTRNVAVSGTVVGTATPPTGVSTAATTAVTFNSATSGGTVTADGGSAITGRGVVYGTAPNPQIGDPGVVQVTASGTTGTFSSSLTGLSASTLYYVAAYATNGIGTTYGTAVTFTTLAPPTAPVGVTTATTTAITTSTATSGGTVTADGGSAITGRGVVYGLNPNPRIGGAGVTQVAATGTTGTFSSSLTGLSASTPYYVAAYATNAVGTTYASDENFTTATPFAGVFEPFESASSPGSGYVDPAAAVTLTSGSWTFYQALTGNLANDNFRGTQGVRIRGGGYLQYDKTGGVGTVSLYAATYKADSNAGFTLQYSTDGGANYTTVSGTPTSGLPTSFGTQPFTYTINVSGAVRIRINSAFTTVGNSTIRLNVDDVSISDFAPAQTISAPTFAGNAFCAGGTAFDVTFTPTGTFNAGNSFVVQLSDAAGAFGASPTVLATLANNNATTAQTVSVSIPATTASGTAYRLRVVATDPAATGPNSVAVTVVNSPAVSISPAPTASTTLATPVSFTGAETPSPATSREWLYGTVSGTYSTATGVTTTSYSFNPPAIGTYYVVLRSVYPGCGAVISNPTTVTVTAPAPTPVITVAPATLGGFSTSQGTPSGAQSYTLSATDLTGPVAVTAPAGYEVSQTSATAGFATSQSVLAAAATAPGLAIYVRLTGTATGTFGTVGTPVNVTNASPGAVTKNVAVSGSVSSSPMLATYSIAGVSNSPVRATSAPATAKDANIATAAPLTRGAGLTAGSSNTNGLFNGSNWGTLNNLADAQAGKKYFAFAITPTVGFLANVTSIVGNAYRTNTAPSTVELLYSTNSDFTDSLSLGTQAVTSQTTPGATFTFTPGTTVLKNVSTPIYFRLYGYTASSASSNFYFLDNGTTPGLIVNGTALASPAPVIVTGAVSPTAVCGGSSLTVSYAAGGPAATGAYFVQLSDANGSFAAPVDLPATNSTSSSVTVTVPGTTANGTAYRVRVANTDGTRGSISSVFTIVSNPTAVVAPTTPQIINAGTPGNILTVTENPVNATRQWYYGTTSGGPYTTAIGGATAPTYTPNFPTAGTYYVIARSTFAACSSVTSNEVMVTVTAPTLTATPTALTGLTTNTGAASAPRTYVLSGTGVLAAVTVTAPTGYEVSLDGSTYAASVSAPAANVNAGQTIYVRLLGSSTGSVSGNVVNTLGSTIVNVAVSGDVLTPPGLLLVEDDFDYTGQLSANGWSGTNISATTAGNITVPMYPQGVLATGGTSRQAFIDGSGTNDLARTATVPAGTTTLYAAALINVSSVNNVTTSGDYIFAFRTAGSVSYRCRITIANVSGSSPARFTFKIRAAGEDPATTQTTPTQFNVNTDYVLVMKAENSAATGNTDKFSLYVLPSGTNLSQEPSAPLLTISGLNVFSTINSFYIHTSDTNNPTFKMDNFRMATGWGTAVGNAGYDAPAATVNPGSYYSLSANNATRLTQAGAVAVENQLALPNGSFDLNGQRLTLVGTVTGSGSLLGSAASNLSVLGTGPLGTLTFAPGAQTLNNLTLNRTGSGAATLGSPLTVNGSLVLTSGALATSVANLLTLATAASVTPIAAATGANVGYVNGPVARPVSANATNAQYLFPVGKLAGTVGNYRPLTLNVTNQGTAATLYLAEQKEGNPGQDGTDPLATDGTTLTRVSRVRSFTLTPYSPASPGTVLQPTGFSGTATLSFDANDFVNLPNAPALVIAKRSDNGQPWANIGRTGNTGSTVTSDVFTSFSDFALASTDPDLANNPLPVELSSFGAQRQADKAVAVSWTTATEKNAERFEVQRSLNAHDFVTVATTKAQGTSTKATAYAILDKTAPAATLYYRLRQVDRDGTAAYSPVAVVGATGETAKVLLYPNPASSTISFIAEAATPYRVLNQLGQPVLHGTTEAGTAKVALETLPVGMYFLELQTPAGRSVQKFEKQ